MSLQPTKVKGKKKAQRINIPFTKRLYTLREAGVYLGRSEYAIRTLVWSGVLAVIKNPNGADSGKKMWVDIADMDSFIERNKKIIQ